MTVTINGKAMPEATDGFRCDPNAPGAHVWVYMGGKNKVYYCSKCGQMITKAMLKSLTEEGD